MNQCRLVKSVGVFGHQFWNR